MIIVPNAKVIVLGGSLKKDVRVIINGYYWSGKIQATMDVETADGSTELVEGMHHDSLEIPPHMLTSKLDFHSVLKEMRGVETGEQAIIEEAIRNCLRVLQIDISVTGKIIFRLGLKVRGDLRFIVEYPEIYKEESYTKLFDFRK